MSDQEFISGEDFENYELEKSDKLKQNSNDDDFLDQLSSEFTDIQNKGFQISKQFAGSDFIGVGEETAQKLSELLNDIKDANKERGFTDRVIGSLPIFAQDFLYKGKSKIERARISNKNIVETTEEIFNQLEAELANLSDQIIAIANMKDDCHRIHLEYEKMKDMIVNRYKEIMENDGFEGRSALEFKYKDRINTIQVNIEGIKQRIFEINSAKVAAEQTLKIKDQIPNLRQELMGGLATAAFVDTISKLQRHSDELFDTISEINISTSSGTQAALLNVTDTSRRNQKLISTIEKQRSINKETEEGMIKNLQKSLSDVNDHNRKLVDMQKEDRAIASKGLLPFEQSKSPDVFDFQKSKKLSNKKNKSSDDL